MEPSLGCKGDAILVGHNSGSGSPVLQLRCELMHYRGGVADHESRSLGVEISKHRKSLEDNG